MKSLFEEYAEAWERETLYASSAGMVVSNLNYQRIIGLGPQAVPLIIARLRHDVGHWFWALSAIVGVDQAAGTETLEDARAAWLRWYDAEIFGD